MSENTDCEVCNNAGLFIYKVNELVKSVEDLRKDVRSLHETIKNGALGACALLIAAVLTFIFK